MTFITRYRPINGTLALPRELDRWMEEAFNGMQWGRGENVREWFPTTDVSETPEHLTFRMEVPGLSREDVKISVENNVLTIRGEKRQSTSSEDENFVRTERSYGGFERSFTLPSHFSHDQVKASLENGILTLRVPRREEARAREIQIESGETTKQIES